MSTQRPMFIYSSYLPAATAAATDAATGHAATNVLTAQEDTSWQPANATGAKSLVVDLSTAIAVNGAAIAGEYLNGVTIEVRGSTDNFVSSDVALCAAKVHDQFIAAWKSWTAASYRYIKFIFTGLGASSEIYHVAVGNFLLLPWFEDGWDPDAFSVDGSHLEAQDGRHLGSVQFKSTYDLSLRFGKITNTEGLIFQRWADACLHTLQAYFLVPDTGQTFCMFGTTDAKFKFTMPRQSGVLKPAAIPFKARKV